MHKPYTVFDPENLEKKFNELENESFNPEIFKDKEKFKKIGIEKKIISEKLDKIKTVQTKIKDLQVYAELIQSENADSDEWKEFSLELSQVKKLVQDLSVETLYTEEYDDCSALVELHSGAGGEEAQDWTDMLHRMYLRYSEKQGYSAKIVNFLYGEGAGYKSISIVVEGEHAYGNLKCERGVHRLVRISPFDANKRRHTSFASVEVSPIVENTNEIKINQDELKIDTFRSGGAGGQHINKTESAVRITHIPTGIVVACQNERSQTQNKEYAMKMLYAKLLEREEKQKQEEKLKKLGKQMKIEWGSQIRSYVLCPYNMVKDHRTNYETGDTDGVLDGDIQDFIIEKLKLDTTI